MLIKIEDIKVRKRVRKDLGDLNALKDSLRNFGLLNPITLNSNHELVAGERRLEAAKALGWETISAVILSPDVDEAKQLEIELEENNQRKEFTDAEIMDGLERLNKLRNPSIFMRIWKAIKSFGRGIAVFFKSIFKHKKTTTVTIKPQTKVTEENK